MRKTILIAGPCAAESEKQVTDTAALLSEQLSQNNFTINYFRTGIWKPRTSPDSFSGVGEAALLWLQKIQEKYAIPVCVEIAKPEQFELCEKFGITNFWIGARTTVNPFIIDELAQAVKGKSYTIMVKNPVIPDLQLWIGAIERFRQAGIENIVAIHRGFSEQNENILRNSPNWEIPIELKVRFPEMPLLCDVSHIAGNKEFIKDIAQLALDFSFDGLMIETHTNPQEALSDAKQQLTPEELITLLKSLTFKDVATSPVEQEIRKYRTQIEHLDNQIARLLASRMELVDSIASVKAAHNLPIVDPKQFKKVVNRYVKDVLEDDDYKMFLTEYLELLHYYSILRQQKFEKNKEL